MTEKQALSLYRIVREAALNTARHANARSLFVTLHLRDTQLHMEIRDDGQGFDPRPASDLLAAGHLGLVLLYERARDLGGTVTLDTAPGRGTTLRICTPMTLLTAEEKLQQEVEKALVAEVGL